MACKDCKMTNASKRLCDGSITRPCALGLKHYPKTEASTINLIKNGGWATICLRNPYKYKHTPAV